MVADAARSKRHGARRYAVAIAASLTANAVLLAGFVWELRVTPTGLEARPIDVELAVAAMPHPATTPSRRNARAAASRHVPAPPFVEPPRLVVVPPVAPGPTTGGSAADLAGLSKAVRTRLGCDFAAAANLSDAERVGCAIRLASYQRNAGPFEVDADKRAVFDAAAKRAAWFQQPFLASDPKNGCRPKVTQTDVGARQGAEWRAVVACGLSF